jgi:hypothetical protein
LPRCRFETPIPKATPRRPPRAARRVGQRLHVGLRQLDPAGVRAARALRPPVALREHVHGVRSQRSDLMLHEVGDAGAHGDQQDHGRGPDEDPEHRENHSGAPVKGQL